MCARGIYTEYFVRVGGICVCFCWVPRVYFGIQVSRVSTRDFREHYAQTLSVSPPTHPPTSLPVAVLVNKGVIRRLCPPAVMVSRLHNCPCHMLPWLCLLAVAHMLPWLRPLAVAFDPFPGYCPGFCPGCRPSCRLGYGSGSYPG